MTHTGQVERMVGRAPSGAAVVTLLFLFGSAAFGGPGAQARQEGGFPQTVHDEKPESEARVMGHALEPYSHRELRQLVVEDAARAEYAGRKVYAVDSWATTRVVARGPSKLRVFTYLDVPRGTNIRAFTYEIIMSDVLPHAEATLMRLFIDGEFVPEEDVHREVFRRTFESKPLAGVGYRAGGRKVADLLMPTEPREFEFQVPEGTHVYAFRLGAMDPEVTVWSQGIWADVEVYSDTHDALPPPGDVVAKHEPTQPLPESVSVGVAFPDGPLHVGGLYRTVLSADLVGGRRASEIRWIEPQAADELSIEVELWDGDSYVGTRQLKFPVLPQPKAERYFVIGMYEQTDGTVMHTVNKRKYYVLSGWCARRHTRGPESDPVLARRSYEKIMPGIAEIGANTVIPFLELIPAHYPQYMAVAARNGLKVIAPTEDMMQILSGGRTRGAFPTNEEIHREVRTNVERLRHYPNFVRYALADEPDMETVGVIDRIIKMFAALDPDHPTYVAFIANSGREGSLTRLVERLSPHRPAQVVVDLYPGIKDTEPAALVAQFSDNMLGSGRTYAGLGLDWWYISQAFGNHVIWRWLTVEEYRFTIHAALACGAKGILHVLYSTTGPDNNQFEYYIEGLVDADGNRRPQWFEVQRLNSYMKSVAPVLMDLTFRDDDFAECGDDAAALVTSHFDSKGNAYVYVVNKNVAKRAEIEVTVRKAGVSQAVTLPAGEPVPVVGGTFMAMLEPGAGALFLLE